MAGEAGVDRRAEVGEEGSALLGAGGGGGPSAPAPSPALFAGRARGDVPADDHETEGLLERLLVGSSAVVLTNRK